MSYYMPQTGDYKTYGYAGDPGFLSSLWGGIKRIAKPILAAAFPVPAAIYSAVRHKPQPTYSFPGGAAGAGLALPLAFQRGGRMPPPGRMPAIGLGPQAGFGGRAAAVAPVDGCCPSGFHLAKDGSGRCVRNRRMNIANPRALRRSMRRVQGFEKLARRTITFTRRVKLKPRKK